MTKAPTVIRIRPADDKHQVVTFSVKGSARKKQKRPCHDCPWRKDRVGIFPPEAFRHSAPTGYDIPETVMLGEKPSTFACHQTGVKAPSTCAGFLLAQSSEHNLALRMSGEDLTEGVEDGGHELFETYYEMAVANGVPADDPRITPCWRPRDGVAG
ncbi:DUF6283 family protein [Acetobacter persici]|uniref:Uncharacterized protein n=1 Tax=Acetobacter persici TaxID=1076596 RepID=A0A1U9LKD0_9PROT|nr:DUF6283 family protein [Acetobacter persici]AQT06740.1 hypothetical protein A0U91_16890 [Acetobacter persici]